MTAEQLQNARASAWRQEGNALLTADDAAAWLREAGFALFLPRPVQIAAPTGSFVEATTGEANPTPKPAAIENATGLLRRLLASGDVVALNLLGVPGDQPDFLATEDTLPFLFALRGDREWKRGPRGKSSPLVVEVWKVLDKDGALTADEVKEKLGRHLTESAALRALTELWTGMRIEPIYAEGEETHWQLLEANHEPAMTAGSAMAQGTALSALVSLYLQTAVAATGDEIEAYLSPLASRSRIRDAVRGLLATRQLGLRNLGASEHFFVEGSLPDFPELSAPGFSEALSSGAPQSVPAVPSGTRSSSAVAKDRAPKNIALNIAPRDKAQRISAVPAMPDLLPEVAAPADIIVKGEEGELRIEALSEAETEHERGMGEGRKRFVAQRSGGTGDRKGFGPRPGGDRKTFGGDRKTFAPRSPSSERKNFGGSGDSSRKNSAAESGSSPAKPFFAREPWKEDRRPTPPAAEGTEQRERSFRPGTESRSRTEGDRKPFAPREGGRPAFGGGDRKPFAPREGGRPASSGGDRKPFAPREGGRPASSGGDRKPFAPREGGRPAFGGGDRKPFAPREGGRPAFGGGDRKPFAPREGGRPAFGGGDRKPFAPREGGRPASSGGDRKPFAPREGGRPAFGGGDRKPFAPREGGRPAFGGSDRKPFAPREGGRPAFGSGDRKPFAPREDGERRPFTPREGEGTPRRTGAPGAAPQRFSPEGGGRPLRPGAPAGAGKPGGKRPRTTPFTSSGKPRAGVSATSRPGPRSTRPGKPASGRKPGAPPRKPGGKGPRRDG